ncbi:MAG: thiaminase II [Halofilum sp. (in: g-proteobacteria)]
MTRDDAAGPIPADSTVGLLRAACPQAWQAYTEHDFVARIADGTLPEAGFRHYLIQDYLFLKQYTRAYALAVYKGETLADMRDAAGAVDALLNTEMGLHVQYCGRWGIDEERMLATPEDPANITYTRYVLDTGMAGDLLDLLVALAPCSCGYGEIGARLLHDANTVLDGNPYRDWIEMYGGEEFQEVSRTAVRQIDAVARRRMGNDPTQSPRWKQLCEIFAKASSLETDFWQMGLDASA